MGVFHPHSTGEHLRDATTEKIMNPMMRCALFLMLIATCVRGDDVKARVNFGNYGSLDLSETTGGVKITARLTNLPAGQHGFHVHQSGDIYTDGCLSTGGHF